MRDIIIFEMLNSMYRRVIGLCTIVYIGCYSRMKEENEKQRERKIEREERDREWHVLKLKLIAQSDRIKCMNPFHFYLIFFSLSIKTDQ